MKIPKVLGRNKIRDAAIIRMYAQDGKSFEDVAEHFKLSSTRIRVIVYRNKDILEYDRKYEKTKRIAHLQRLLNKHPEKVDKESTLDILEMLRKEIEGEKPIVDQSTHLTSINYAWQNDNNPLLPSRLPEGNPLVEEKI